jgi:predicted secreted protein
MSVIELGADANGSTVAAHPGDELVVRLSENASSGYQWQLDPLPPWLGLAVDAVEPPASMLPGAGGVRILRITVDGPGDATVTLSQRRPWEPATIPALGQFAVTVKATGG